jgi:hypothetical protein
VDQYYDRQQSIYNKNSNITKQLIKVGTVNKIYIKLCAIKFQYEYQKHKMELFSFLNKTHFDYIYFLRYKLTSSPRLVSITAFRTATLYCKLFPCNSQRNTGYQIMVHSLVFKRIMENTSILWHVHKL